ncbi:ParB N-terminal domain-containing protein [Actinokineospora spheciospongiae]|uniref:DNA sulfur modification protein DndB n=1 Tax=Actinokineospora spheciospongiae TaxID=909613 RepID=UPI000D70C35D|nr:DNA sulfur modification protein DndB [Actinokineospora spheciospongiae]PWW65618.1 DndB-like DNA-sulfur modification-associated protein [Actinokineospora spheciospongiae]
MFGSGTKLVFRDYVQGTWGKFSTPAGQVDYIMTKARLGEDSDDPERQLTKSLAPVREVMEAEDLDFNQLLQRDLDDHRVAVKLIPYLLRQQMTGPAFFPPVVAVLLPFRSKRPSAFPELGPATEVEDDHARWQQEDAGSSFRVQRLLDDNSRLHPASVGKLWWNKTESQLVVLDGQHRAMALLAIERTMTSSWQNSSGARFRSFYEHQVKQALQDATADHMDLSKIEVPVTVCWFPGETGDGANPHKAARKLFVDVNKEARPPSDSRIILLSDAELGNILARRMLSDLRNGIDQEFLPLYAVEYDNPEVNSNRPARWSVLTNIHLLKLAVDRCVFGPSRHLQNVSATVLGRPNLTEQDTHMRKQLDMTSLFPDEFDDGAITYRRDKIGNTEFPQGQVSKIADRFAATWGQAILTLLSKTAPYAAHGRALTKLKEEWHVDDTWLRLAHDAIFGGVGVYWTLKDSHEHFQEKYSRDKSTSKSDVVRAWDALKGREANFEIHRTAEFLNSAKPGNLKPAKAAFAVFNTHACQLGLAMTLGSLWELVRDRDDVGLDDLPRFANDLVSGLNAFFAQENGKARDRRLAFNKSEVSSPINQIASMESSQSVYFRYFWLQALATPVAWEKVSRWFSEPSSFADMVEDARGFYLKLCTEQQLKALKQSRPGTAETRLREDAAQAANKFLKRALRDWFYVPDEQYDEWSAASSERTKTTDEDSQSSSEADAGSDADGDVDNDPIGRLEDLLED